MEKTNEQRNDINNIEDLWKDGGMVESTKMVEGTSQIQEMI